MGVLQLEPNFHMAAGFKRKSTLTVTHPSTNLELGLLEPNPELPRKILGEPGPPALSCPERFWASQGRGPELPGKFLGESGFGKTSRLSHALQRLLFFAALDVQHFSSALFWPS